MSIESEYGTCTAFLVIVIFVIIFVVVVIKLWGQNIIEFFKGNVFDD